MKNFYKILIGLMLFFMTPFSVSSAPQQLQVLTDTSADEKDAVTLRSPLLLKGGIQCVQELPKGMYGMWQVRGTLVETNNGSLYASNSSDVWILRKDGDYVTLINPRSGARATITVTEVQNNTATFERSTESNNSVNTEHVTITLQGNTFVGTDVIVSKYKIPGSRIVTTAKYRLHGDKIMGQTIYEHK